MSINIRNLKVSLGGSTFDTTTDSLEAISDKLITGITSASSGGFIVEDGTDGTPNITTVATSGTANTFGSWTQIDASLAQDSYICGISINAPSVANANENFVLEIGTGANPSEVTKLRFSFVIAYRLVTDVENSTFMPTYLPLSIPVKIASGTRITARVSNSSANARDLYVGVQYYKTLS